MDAKTENHSFETYPRLLRPWKTNIALQVLAVPLLRAVFGRIALSYLHTCILLETRALAFILLSRLGVTRDIVFTWHILNLLRCVPESVFNDKWISLAVLHVGSIPGASVSDRIRVCEQVILHIFGLWKAVGKAAESNIDLKAFSKSTSLISPSDRK